LRPISILREERKFAVCRIEPELLNRLRLVKGRDGLPIIWQVRQAIGAWLDSKGAVVKAAAGSVSARTETLTVNLL
jgi:hypothetical protein